MRTLFTLTSAGLEALHAVLKEGGIAVIDQRNYDALLDRGEEGRGQAGISRLGGGAEQFPVAFPQARLQVEAAGTAPLRAAIRGRSTMERKMVLIPSPTTTMRIAPMVSARKTRR